MAFPGAAPAASLTRHVSRSITRPLRNSKDNAGEAFYGEASTPRPPSPFHGEGGEPLRYIVVYTTLFLSPSRWRGEGSRRLEGVRLRLASPGDLAFALPGLRNFHPAEILFRKSNYGRACSIAYARRGDPGSLGPVRGRRYPCAPAGPTARRPYEIHRWPGSFPRPPFRTGANSRASIHPGLPEHASSACHIADAGGAGRLAGAAGRL